MSSLRWLVAVGAGICAVAIASAANPAPGTDERTPSNLFEWVQRAPMVAVGTSLGENGRYFELRVGTPLRGALEPGAVIDIDVRFANRERDRLLDPAPLRLDAGMDFALLLEPVATEKVSYRLVRGVHGAWKLPAEGRPALLEALRRFVNLQDSGSEAVVWAGLEEMLGESSPLLLETALQQFRKFHRGTPEMLADLRPLLDHPQSELRGHAAALIEQILDRDPSSVPEEDALRTALVARARRDADPSVRVAAARALATLPGPAVAEVLQEIAASDAEQDVRYAAEVLLLERRSGAPVQAREARPNP